MSFEKLKKKVTQAEHALEAHERHLAADWRQFRASWRSTWTPGRIVTAGLASGLAVGFMEPLRKITGGGVLRTLASLSTLMASSSAQVAAEDAEHAADTAAVAVGEGPVVAAAARLATAEPAAVPRAEAPARRHYELPDSFRDRGQL